VRCVVVGAGRVAERKIASLLRVGARVRVIAPRATPRIRALFRRRALIWRRGGYRRGDLRGARLVFAATDDAATNRTVSRDARHLGLFCNVSDQPELGAVQMPAILRRGDLIVAVSTCGESPALARRIRDEVGRHLGPEYALYLKIIGSVRRRLRTAVRDPVQRVRLQRRLLRLPLLGLLRAGRVEAARCAAHAAGGVARR
jgi:precorrin-2 dehydrogenase/sirohydrochlorin ferrochelatase